MHRLLTRWIVSSLAIAAVAWWMPGIRAGQGLEGALTVLVTAAFLGLVNAIVRPILTLLSCPLILVTLGLFLFVINAAMLLLAAALARASGFEFEVASLGTAVVGSVLISLVTWFLSLFMGDRDGRDRDARERRR